ncbi:hypothetical protein ACFE04_021341 [Oxalis oulophora]
MASIGFGMLSPDIVLRILSMMTIPLSPLLSLPLTASLYSSALSIILWNLFHGSDSIESGKREISLWFPEGTVNCLSSQHAWTIDNTPIDFKGRFGGGRRVCPGIHLGTTRVELVLANLMYYFDWKLPYGMKEEDMNMEEGLGQRLDVHKEVPLELVPDSYIQ